MLMLEYNVSQALKATYENLKSEHYKMAAWFQLLYLEAMDNLRDYHDKTNESDYLDFLDFLKSVRNS
jgi:hypothetical protein